MRLFAAILATKTNTFSPLPTDLDACEESVLSRPDEHPDAATCMICSDSDALVTHGYRGLSYTKVQRSGSTLDREAESGPII